MDDFFAEKDPTGRYIRYNELFGSDDDDDDAVFKQYKAFDESDGVEVAWIQISMDDRSLSPDQLRVLCDRDQIDLLKSLKHENVVRFHDYWIDDENKRINVVMESFASGSLREYRTNKHKKIDIKVIKNWARQILRGLHYLHTHNPPLFLQDFTCDEVFVNGYNGEVKIGTDFGLGIVKKAASTDQNNVYCFGMCLLEMITCENPYTEPGTLSRVVDPKAKDLIQKCLSPSSTRLGAIDLLNHPFLAAESCKEIVSSDPICKQKQVSQKLQSESQNKEKIVQLVLSSEKNAYGLRGMQIDERTVSFTLDVVNKPSGRKQKIEFPYDLDSDTSVSVAAEMIEQLDFSGQDVAVVVKLIDALLMEIVGYSKNKPIRKQNNLPSDARTTLPLSNDRDDEQDELKLQLDAIDTQYVKRFQQLLKNISII